MDERSTIQAGLPRRLGRYVILDEIGRGSMGIVYRARDSRLAREVAIKVLPAQAGLPDRARVKRFTREATLLAALNHPNIATIYDLDDAAGEPFIVQELIEGQSLEERLLAGVVTLDESLALSRQIAIALEAAHKKDVVHRDLKPANVKITPDGLVKVLDFGIATMIGADDRHSTLTGEGAIAGTPGYMSPEQLDGEPVDGRADIWALGCVLFECLAGRRPFTGKNAFEVMVATRARDPDWECLPAGTPSSIRALLERCLAKAPEDRPATVIEVRRAIDDLIARPSTAELAASCRATASPNNLPAQLTSFVGRTKELEEAARLLREHRLLTLTGTGGSGKSRLALELAAGALADFPGGVWFVDLAPLADPGRVPQAAMAAVGLKEQRGKTVMETLLAEVGGATLLLVLDNCEHLISGCAELAQSILHASSGPSILATSREALAVGGEQLYPVPPLATPPADGALSFDRLRESESVQLFTQRATALNRSFVLNEDNAGAVAEICRRLDGIPLAIELAAARMRSVSPAELAARLDQRFQLLTGGQRTGLKRHQTLRGLIDWSYEQLEADEQAVFRRFSLFAGGSSLAAAEAVCTGETIEEWQVLDLFTRLFDKSLIERDAEPGARRTRYRMLETLRQYARERLDEAGETAEARARHRDFFLALAEEANPRLSGPEQKLWLERLEAEHDNLLAALDWQDGEGVEKALRLAASMWPYWQARGHFSLGRELLARVLARDTEMRSVSARAQALIGAGRLALDQGDHESARAFAEKGLEICRELGDREAAGGALTLLGHAAYDRSDYEAAQAFYEKSLEISRELGDPARIATSLMGLGNLKNAQGEYESARALLELSLAIRRDLNDPGALADALNNLGNVVSNQGDSELARSIHEEGLQIRRELGDPRGVAMSLHNLAIEASIQHDYDAAVAFEEESLAIRRELGDRAGIASSLIGLGDALHRQGKNESARALLEESLAIQRGMAGHRTRLATALSNLGSIALDQGDHESAGAYHRECLEIRRDLGGPFGIAVSLERAGAAAEKLGDLVGYTRLLAASKKIRDEIGAAYGAQGQAELDAAVAVLRDRLGSETLEREWTAGQSMSLDQAVDRAFQTWDRLAGGEWPCSE